MTVIWVFFAACVALASWFLVPYGLRRMAEYRLASLCRKHRAVVLSYDDGPSAAITPRLIDLLAQHDVKATFFVLGRNAAQAPDVVTALRQAGHEIGSHTYDHTNAWKAGPLRVARDLEKGVELTARMGGDKHLFRPPFGKLTLAGLIDGARRRLRYGWWTIDSKDSWDRRPIQEVVDEIAAGNGGVVLMHDFDSYPRHDASTNASHGEHVLALTERVLEFAKLQGYRVMPLGALYDLAGTR